MFCGVVCLALRELNTTAGLAQANLLAFNFARVARALPPRSAAWGKASRVSTVPIPGAKDAAQAAGVVGCLGWRLSEGEVRELEKAAGKVPASPGAPFEAW